MAFIVHFDYEELKKGKKIPHSYDEQYIGIITFRVFAITHTKGLLSLIIIYIIIYSACFGIKMNTKYRKIFIVISLSIFV